MIAEESIILCRELSVQLPAAPHPLLTNVDLKIEKGDFFFIRGGNGSGKTLLAKTFLGIEVPSSGELFVLGREASRFSRRDWARWRKTIGYFPQQDDLMIDVPVKDQVMISLSVAGWEKSKAVQRVDKVLEEVGLATKKNMLPRQLSFSERKLLVLARCLARLPLLLVADQPLDGLDREAVYHFLNLIQDYRTRGMTVILITQRLTPTQMSACRGIYLSRGRIIERYEGQES